MKIIEREVIKKEIRYQSIDGKVFDTKENCKTHEEIVIKLEWNNNIKKKIISAVSICLPYVTYENDTYMVFPQNLKDIEIINGYIQIETEDDNPDILDLEDINQVIVLDFEADHFTCHKINLKEHLKKIQKAGKDYLNYFLMGGD